ncbi:MAG: class I SAM-dependent DNA methyltransferase [Balneolaceae bacterium]
MTDHISQTELKNDYTILAQIYDAVMADVDYEAWSDFIDEIIMHHHYEATELLELACGTGTMAIKLEELGYYNITATDASEAMIDVARRKAQQAESSVVFHPMNMLELQTDRTFDIVYMVFDSLNYLHTEEEILKLHANVRNCLNDGGLFIYDFTTPDNSKRAVRYLNNEKKKVDSRYRYERRSHYNHDRRTHTNVFHISLLDNNGTVSEVLQEKHQQRIYTFDEVRNIIQKTEFEIVEAYNNFDFKVATNKSLRITMVLQ